MKEVVGSHEFRIMVGLHEMISFKRYIECTMKNSLQHEFQSIASEPCETTQKTNGI
jgi:hypothetical protein